MGFPSGMADFIRDDAVTTSGRSHGRRGDAGGNCHGNPFSRRRRRDLRRALDNRSTRGVRREKLSKGGALERTGIAFSGVVGFREAADKSLIELGTFGFAELMPDGFPS
jgi:hypothetical protein